MSELQDINSFVGISAIVSGVVMDTYGDFGTMERMVLYQASRGIKKLTRETLKSGKRSVILNVNKNTNTAVLPADYKRDLGVFYVCNDKKYPLKRNILIVGLDNIEEIPTELECGQCTGCYNKQLCNDLVATQTRTPIDINGTNYDETVTSTLLPSGEYYVITRTPYFNNGTSTVLYLEKKEYVTTFETSGCGCIKDTPDNANKVKSCSFDSYACWCAPCDVCPDSLTYNIFVESGIIQFSPGFPYDKVLFEYQGFLPKRNGEYIFPEVALETLINFVKFKMVENKKGVALSERQWTFAQYVRERDNMTKVLGRLTLTEIIQRVLVTPKLDFTTR